MRNTSWGWILVPATMLGFLTVFYWSGSRRSSLRETDTRLELDALRREIKQLREEGADYASLVAQSVNSRERAPSGELTAAPSATLPAVRSDSSANAAGAETHRPTLTEAEIGAQLDDKFAAEHVDPTWSQGATSAATRALAGALAKGTTLGKVECRTNLCKVESFHENADAFRQFAENAFMNHDRQLWNGGIATMIRAESTSGVTAVSYIAKEGQGVPVPEIGEE